MDGFRGSLIASIRAVAVYIFFLDHLMSGVTHGAINRLTF